MPVKLDIRVEGLRELRKALKELDPAWGKELQKTNKRAAALVVPTAQSRAGQVRTNLVGNPTRLGSRGIATIRPLASQSRAQIAMGGARAPWAGGHEWGSTRYRQFPPKTHEGNILWGAAKSHEEQIVEVYGDMLDDLTREAFPE